MDTTVRTVIQVQSQSHKTRRYTHPIMICNKCPTGVLASAIRNMTQQTKWTRIRITIHKQQDVRKITKTQKRRGANGGKEEWDRVDSCTEKKKK